MPALKWLCFAFVCHIANVQSFFWLLAIVNRRYDLGNKARTKSLSIDIRLHA